MFFLLLRFEIPANKINEFDLAFRQIVKWPVYALYTIGEEAHTKTFELTREWESETEMQQELESPDFVNMIGMVRVLGNLLTSRLYNVSGESNILQTIH